MYTTHGIYIIYVHSGIMLMMYGIKTNVGKLTPIGSQQAPCCANYCECFCDGR